MLAASTGCLRSAGGLISLRDLSVFMDGEDARFAARECLEGAEKVSGELFDYKYKSIPFLFFNGAVFAILFVLSLSFTHFFQNSFFCG